MSLTLIIAQLVRETGAHESEAQNAAEMARGNIEEARRALQSELAFRRQRYTKPLMAVFRKYSSGDATDFDGTITFLNDLQVSPEHEVVLAIVYELGATQVGVFKSQEFIDGWGRLGCTSVAEMRKTVSRLAEKMLSDFHYFQRVYRNTFKYNLEPGHRLLDIDTAKSYWELLLSPRYSGVDRWIEFMSGQGPKVSGDTWNMYLEFCQYAREDPELKNYDENSSWPVVIDDFVDTLRS